MTEPKKSVNFCLDDDDDVLDLATFKPKGSEPTVSAKDVEKATSSSGFKSRQPTNDSSTKAATKRPRTTKRKRPISPYKDQLNVKCKTKTKLEFQQLAEQEGIYDYQLFELMIEAFKKDKDTSNG